MFPSRSPLVWPHLLEPRCVSPAPRRGRWLGTARGRSMCLWSGWTTPWTPWTPREQQLSLLLQHYCCDKLGGEAEGEERYQQAEEVEEEEDHPKRSWD
ncbi:hypothetical protein CRUP_004137 [Coryphaenoides rupestris]|nr:hypothetical protein CRUP_004137 [Coryphaenoides rupestris]